MYNGLFHSMYVTVSSLGLQKCVEVLIIEPIETWGEGVTGSRAFREGDEGIRVREWP